MPEWIGLRVPDRGEFKTVHAPFSPDVATALVRAARTVHRAPTPMRGEPHHSVYVALLQFNAGVFGLYVGLTGLTPEERFSNHKAGHKASRWPRRYGIGLLPALYRHLNPLAWEQAASAEVALAEALRTTGMRVEQG